MSPRFDHRTPAPPGAKFVGAVVGLIFAGIGITVIASLWGARWGGFGSPPLFFRIFGTLIALAFVAVGGAVAVGAMTAGKNASKMWRDVADRLDDAAERPEPPSNDTARPVYACSQCGAPLGKGAEISPHGDVKCGHCHCWFNVRGT